MRKPFAALVAVLSVVVFSGQSGAKTETVTGEVIDLICYARYKVIGMHHNRALECAWACVRWEGQPAALLTSDGRVYQVAGGLAANSNEKIATHLGEIVSVTGEITVVDGLPMIAADDVKVVKQATR